MREIQLVENLQRENPHPLHEAQAILSLQQSGKTLEEVARVLGKPKTFIYNRLKLAELIEPLQEMFSAGKLSLSEAVELGSLAADAQQEFFTDHCGNWKEEKHFSIGNTKYYISRYKYDLKNAPFSTRDKKLLPDVGACTGCPFNSASLKALFPDMAKEAVCNNKACFKNKCVAATQLKMQNVLETHPPEGLLLGYSVSEESQALMDSLPEIMELPRYGQYDVQVLREPVVPQKEDYVLYDQEKGKEVLMRERYNAAIQEYRDDLAGYRQQLKAEGTRRGLLLRNADIIAVYYDPEKRNSGDNSGKQVTAKEVQQAIKDGTVTVELLQGEIDRIKSREDRAKELDREKVQLAVYEQYAEALKQNRLKASLSKADTVAIRHIVYDSLGWHSRTEVDKVLFPKGYKDNKTLFEKLSTLDNAKWAFLIRTAISQRSDCKMPETKDGYCLYQMAEADGLDVSTIEAEQTTKTQQREERLKARIKELQARIKKMKTDK